MGGRSREDLISRRKRGLLFLVLLALGSSSLAAVTELSPADGICRYGQLVRLYPDSAPYHNALGYYQFKAGFLDEAEASYLRALGIDRAYAVAHNNIGIVYLHLQKPEQAEAHFRQALAISPAYVKAQYNLAVALFRQHRYIDAVQAYLVARKQDWAYVRDRDDPEKMKAALAEANKDLESKLELERIRQEDSSSK
ncbi:MAG TPA: tetratricopeptide repeat protein [Syntrophobacteria bacterium]|nr:tetratricopeptide repeat protein [Syntrophobacteria bacterium]